MVSDCACCLGRKSDCRQSLFVEIMIRSTSLRFDRQKKNRPGREECMRTRGLFLPSISIIFLYFSVCSLESYPGISGIDGIKREIDNIRLYLDEIKRQMMGMPDHVSFLLLMHFGPPIV